MISDEKIVDGCRAGKRKAFSLLYKKYSSTMLGLCMRYCKNLADAEDVLQEGFIKVFRKIEKYRGEGSFEGWIKRIMINTAIDHYQQGLKHSYHSNVDELDGISMLVADPEEDDNLYKEHFSGEQLMDMVQKLPDGYRMVFNLYAIEGYGHKEIGRMLQITENTSKSQLHKARRTLKQQLADLIEKRTMNTIPR